MSKMLENIEDAIASDYEDISELQGDIDKQLETIVQEFDLDDNDVKFVIKVHKVIPKSSERPYLFECTPQDLPILDYIRDNYGTGTYETRIYRNGKLYKKPSFSVLAPGSIEKTGGLPKPKNQPLGGNTENMSDILRAINEQNQMMLERMAGLIEKATAPQALQYDPMQQQMQMLQMMKMMREITGPQQTDNGMTMFLKGVEMMKEFAGADKESNMSDVFGKLIDNFAPPLVEVSKKMIEQDEQKQEEKPMLNTLKNKAAAIGGAVKQGAENMAFRQHVDRLVTLAAQNKDPGLYAEVLIDNIPPQYLVRFKLEIVDAPDAVQKLAALNPAVNQYADWFAELHSALRELLTDEGVGLTPKENPVITPANETETQGQTIEAGTATAKTETRADNGDA